MDRISFSRGKAKIRHNNREFISPNVDPERVQDNIVIKQQPLDEAYKEIFGDAIEKYNAKQQRASRKIDDYFFKLFGNNEYDTVQKNDNKQQSFYEYVVGVGDRETTGYASNLEAAKRAEKCLQIYLKGDKNLGVKSFAERNPKFHIFNAVIHCDEATPHLHYDFVPFGDGYKTGMTRQQGIAKALEQMGYGKGKDGVSNFTHSERAVFRKICEQNGFEIAEEQKGRGHTFSSQEYGKEKDKMREKILQEVEQEKTKKQEEIAGYVQALKPTEKKTVKSFLGEKEVAKTAEEMQRDKDVAAAQAALKIVEEEKKKAKDVQAKAQAAIHNANAKEQYLNRQGQKFIDEICAWEINIRTQVENIVKAILPQRSTYEVREQAAIAEKMLKSIEPAMQQQAAQTIQNVQKIISTKGKNSYERD